jgi:hypothetical protein
MCFTYSKQQQKAKMPAAGATQAHRLFCDPLVEINRKKLKGDNKKKKSVWLR